MPIAFIGPEPIRRKPGPYSEILEAAGFTLVYPDGDGTVTEGQLRRLLPDADVAMAGGEIYTSDLMDLAPRLRILARAGVGYDAVDVDAATAREIAVAITPGTNQESVAEQAFGLLLGLTRKVAYYDRLIRSGGWERDLVSPIRGKVLGLVGLGRIGRAMVPRAIAFGMTVVAYDPAEDPAFDAQHRLRRVEYDDLLATADVVSLHAPSTPSTYKMMNAKAFALMKPGAILLNTARGGLVDEAALLAALESGHLGGACLDVFDPEPPRPDNPLTRHPNVVSTPHVAGIDSKSMDDMAALAARCMVEVYRGGWPLDCMVNPELAAQRARAIIPPREGVQ